MERRWLGLHIFLWVLGLACHWASYQIWGFLRVPADALISVGEFCLVFQMMNMLAIIKKWLDLLGNYSYGIFLTHMNIFTGLWLVLGNLVSFYWARLVLITIITCILGGFLEFGYNWVSKKILLTKPA